MDAVSLLWFFIIYTLFFVFVAVCYFCGCFNGLISTKICSVASVFSSCFKRIMPAKLLEILGNLLNYVFYERNPILQFVYGSLLFAGYSVYTSTAFPFVSESFTGRLPYYLLIINLILFAACCCTDPGLITSSTIDKYLTDYAYDGTMYKPKDCSTCSLKKPARSKHCSMCNACVARFDHHCSFLNVCIGRNNYRFFVLLLFSLVLMCGVSSFMIIMVFIHIVELNSLQHAQYTDKYGVIHEASPRTVIQYLAMSYPLMSLLLVFLVCLFLVLSCFFLFHLYLVLVNKTTNELISKRKLPQARDCIKDSRTGRGSAKNEHSSWTIFGHYSKGVAHNTWEVFFPR